MIPRYGEWAKRFGEKLTVVGVHAPETAAERDVERLRRYVSEHKIEWPIVLDPDFAAWSAFGVEAWPTIFVIDRDGRIRAAFVGDDRGTEIEKEIERSMST